MINILSSDKSILISEKEFIEPEWVDIEGQFKIAPTTVTFDEYLLFCTDQKKEIPSDMDWGHGDQPIKNVSALDACDYCNWLSAKLGFEPPYLVDRQKNEITLLHDRGVLLPSEKEWLLAAGDVQEQDLAEVAWTAENSNGHAHPVAQLKPNKYGLYDMIGNVWEIILNF